MSSFHTLRAHVHDQTLPPYRRLSALRSCLQMFAPYGFQATYHHLVISARIPGHLDRDPQALVRAVDELHAARALWLPAEALYAERRRTEKAAGQRQPHPRDAWRAWKRGWNNLGFYCPDPRRHPDLALPDAIRHALDVSTRGTAGTCPLGHGANSISWKDGTRRYQLCSTCGIALSAHYDPVNLRRVEAVRQNWHDIWHRTDSTES